ncbi:MAG: SPFH domain-containing protein [Fibrobacterales bacterium]
MMEYGLGILVGVPIIAMITIGVIFAKLYTRSTKELSFVRTGLGGQKVIMNGGALVLPVLHDIIMVNMNTIRLEVNRCNEQSLITMDRMRVDVTAEFYVRVQPVTDSIADAAQTLGKRTQEIDELKELVEGKFVDALRSVAAEMTMEQLHEKRTDFVQKVQSAVSEDLLKNGMELESVSLTSLDQTNKDYFNPNNAFDAEGLTKLTQEIEARKKMRNDIEQDTSIQMKTKNLEAEKLALEISKETEYARMEQKREVDVRLAIENASVAKEQADKRKESEEANIIADQRVKSTQIIAEKKIQEEEIEKEKVLKEKEIVKEQTIQSAQILKEKTVKIAEQDKAIAISEKSKEESEMNAEAENARALAVKAEEEVKTVQETEVANRNKQIELIKAMESAEKEAIAITVAAEADKRAAQDQAEAITIASNAEAEKERIIAKGQADAEVLKAEAAAKKYEVDAAGTKALHDAENLLSENIIDMKVRLATIENLPGIIEQSVRPMESIDSIKIVQVDGLTGGGNNGAAVEGVSNASTGLGDQIVNSALRYRGQAPLVDSILKEVGLNAGSLSGLTDVLKSATGETPEI